MYVQIRSFDNYLYANIVLNRLKDEGFDCYLKDENTVTIDPLLSPAIGGMKLMVMEPDAASASALLDSIEADYVATIPCPSCGQRALQQLKKINKPGNFFSALLAQLIDGSMEQEKRFYRCSNCGSTMDEMPAADNGPGEE